jgi:pSer/pThr/pTyr-binding forkhead associated (FHA) protein
MPKLTYVTGGVTRSIEVGDSVSIGSLAGNTIVLDAAEGVSRRHAQILRIHGGFEIADLGSTNGTKVNGALVKRRKLMSGDRIEVGKTVLTYQDESGSPVEDEISIEEPAAAVSSPAPAHASSRSATAAATETCILVFAGGDEDGKKIPLDRQRVTFGRNAKNTVPLNDAGASGFHAEIAREGGAYILRDLGSTNGTLVDGEPVSETALQHGARIRMGATKFVFVDPSVSDFEKAMAAVDDLGSEWGLLRAEMDMSRVQAARRSQAIVVLLVLLVVGGGAALIISKPDLLRGEKKRLTETEGNRIEDFSFEDKGGSAWVPREGTPTKARLADKTDGESHQGTAFYAVARDGPGGAAAAAQSTALFTVSPGSPVTFGGFVRTSGNALAGFRMSWLDKPDANGREIGRTSTPLVSGGAWQEVKGSASPPEGVRAARLELLDAGGGTAYFDDVFIVVGGTPGGGSATDGRISLHATSDAQISISRDAPLLVAGAVVGGALRAAAVADPVLRGDRSGSADIRSAAAAANGIQAKGRVVDAASLEPKDFTLEIKTREGRYVDLDATLGSPEAAFVAVLPEEFVKAGVGVRTEGYTRLVDPHLYDKVQEVTFGGPHSFKVTRDEKSGPLRVAFYKVGDVWEIAFGAADGHLVLTIDTDSQKLNEEVQRLRSEASTAQQQRKLGLAISQLKKLSGLSPAGSAEATDAEKQMKAIEEDGKERLDRLATRTDGAVVFHDANDLRACRNEAGQLAAEFEGHEFAATAKTIEKKASDAYEADKRAAMERMAAPLYRKAEDFLRRQSADGKPDPWKTLAKAFLNDIVQRFPDTEAAKKAREKLAGL